MDTEPTTRTERIPIGRGDRLEALVRGAGDHLERLIDVGTAANGDLLLVLPRPAARLPELLAVPGWPVRAEAVTLLVPLVSALARLHAAGVAHGGVAPSAVVLDPDGSPALVAPTAPVLREQAGERAFTAAVADDLERLDSLALSVLGRAGGVLDLPSASDPAAFADALFGIADPVPIRLRPPAAFPLDPLPARLTAPQIAPDAAARASSVLGRLMPPIAGSLRRVRPRAWLLAGCAVAALIAAVTLLPGGGADAVAPVPSSTPSARATTRAAVSVPRTAQPLTALRLLLAARTACLAASDESCLADVESPGSPAAHDDRAAVLSGTAAIHVSADHLRLLSHSGGTATGDAGGVTVLAVREPTGWRLRDVIAPR